MNPRIDPSGYVYEAVASNRLQGVTVTAFYQENGVAHFWDASVYDDSNPLITDGIGWYEWVVPIGLWKVIAELDGYQTTYSSDIYGWLPVPPPQLEVHLPMVSFAQPYVKNVNAYEDYIEIAFSRYMDISTLSHANIVVTQGGFPIFGTIKMVNAEENPMNPTEEFASKVRFVFDTPFAASETVQLSIGSDVKSYADVAMGTAYNESLTIVVEVQTLQADSLSMTSGDISNIEATLAPYGAAAGKKILVHSNSSHIATASNEVIVNQGGIALIPVTAHLPGVAFFTLELEGTSLQTEVMVTVGMPNVVYGISLNPTSDKDFGTVEFGYGAQTAHSVEISNSGNQPTGFLSIALSDDNADSFTLSRTSINNLGIGQIIEFTVAPRTGLAAGTYTATVTVSGSNVTSRSFNVSFIVEEAPQTDAQAVAADKAALTWSVISGENLAENNVTVNLDTLSLTGENGTTIGWQSDNTAIISNTGAVTRPAYGSGNATVTLTATITKNAASDTVVFILTVKELSQTDGQAVAADKATLTWNLIAGSNSAENNVTANLGALPSTGASGTIISWQSNNTAVVSNSGTVTRPVYGNGDAIVTLTATVTKNAASDTVVFTLIVKELPQTDAQAVAAVKAALTWSVIAGSNSAENNVTTNLNTLPTSGASGTTIGWVSNNTAVVSNNGAVIRPSFGSGDATVTLTASITKGLSSDTVVFTLTVKELPQNDAQAVAADKSALTWSAIAGGNPVQNNVTVDLGTLPPSGANGTTIGWVSNNTAVVSNSGSVTRPTFGNGDATVTLTATINKGASSDTIIFTLIVKELPQTDAQAVAADKSVLTWSIIAGGNSAQNTVKVNLGTLPSSGANGTTIGWVSNNTVVVSNSGAVTRPAYGSGDAAVTLTATITKGAVSDTVVFALTVKELLQTDYTITFNANGGFVIPTTMQTSADGRLSNLPIATRSNYRFDGWFTATSGGTQITTSTVFTENDTVFARWTFTGGASGWTPPFATPEPTLDPAGSGTTPETDATDTATGIINGSSLELRQNADGSVSLILTADDVVKYPMTNNVFTIEINDKQTLFVSFPISAVENASVVQIKTDNGTVVLTRKTLQAYKLAQGDIFEISIRAGSFVVELLHNGTAINYNDSANPLFISLPVTVAADTTANGYVAVRREASGNVIIPYSIYRSGEVSFQTPSTGTFDVIYNARTFTDVQRHWALSNINFVSARGLFGGIGNDLFRPDSSMTRAMFAQVLANIEGIDLTAYTTSRFTDVAVDMWYAPAVEWAARVGIVNGVGDNRFAPETSITREQMAVMLVNYVNYKGYTLPAEQTTTFSDEASISSWARDAVKMIQAAGIINGRPGNLYDPKATATRAEVATIFARFIEIYVDYAQHPDATVNQPTSIATFNSAMDVYIDRRALEAIEEALTDTALDGDTDIDFLVNLLFR
jgi:uncharacterized membrane protein